MNPTAVNKPLRGVRVLDLSQYIPGPYASWKMLQLGAEIIKIEPPGGDPMRTLGTPKGQISPLYRTLNQGKKVLRLNLKNPEERATIFALLEQANVFLEGFRPGALARLGLSYETLHELKPSLVICSLSGYGQVGDYAQRAGHDLGYGARAGLYSQAEGSGGLQAVYPPVADHASALNALGQINAALYQQARTGRGSVLDVSIHGTLCDWQYMFEDAALANQLSGELACYQVYQTLDSRHITLAALEPKFWAEFCRVVDRPTWLARQYEARPQTDLISELQVLFASRSLPEWQAQLGSCDCCFEIVPTSEEIRTLYERRSPENESLPPIRLETGETVAWST